VALALSDEQARALRLRAQRLTRQQADEVNTVVGVAQALCGIQAQDAQAAALAVRVRSTGLVAADVERAQATERTVARTWGMRNTLHLLAAEDVGWLLPLLGPVNIAGCQRRYAELGLDAETLARGVRAICDVLERQGACTRAEIVTHLASVGIRAEGQAAPYLLNRAALEGLICLGPDRGAKTTYVLLGSWAKTGRSLSPEEALAELALRYLSAYGPATLADLAAWSGMPMSQLRVGWQHIHDQVAEVEISGAPAWMLKTRLDWLEEPLAERPLVRLLPAFDTYLLGYRSRDFMVASQFVKRINAGGGMLHPVVLVDGRAVGTWKIKRQRDHLEIIVEPFDRLAPEVQPGLETEAADLGRFLGTKAEVRVL
jgi:hypothetical protein